MKKIIMLMTILIITSACEKGEKHKETPRETGYKTVRIEDIEEGIIIRNDISSGIIAPINEAVHMSDTGGEAVRIKRGNGDRVEAGDLIMKLQDQNTTTTYLKAEADLVAARSKYGTRKSNYEKFEKLYHEDLISEDEYFDIRNSYNLSRSQLMMAKANHVHAKRDYDNLEIRAKISGIVTDMDINLYERMGANDPLFTLVDDSVMRINSSVSPEELDSLDIGGRAVISPETLDHDYEGRVYEINPVADHLTKKYPVRIEVPNESGRLRKGMYARVKVDTGSKKGYLVPKEAIVVRDLYSYIYIVEEDIVREIGIERGYGSGDRVEVISSELPEEFSVVIEGQFLLEDRDHVRVM